VAAGAGQVLSIARRGVVIAVGGTALLVEASGRLLGEAATAGKRHIAAGNAAAERKPVRRPGRSERKA
jgi:hypothetical protein